ncbi:MAG TPA: hypothetical protein VGM64_06620, partial [Lacunisphaera sp.]
NHRRQVCGQSSGKLKIFDLGVDERATVGEAQGLEHHFPEEGGEFEEFGAEMNPQAAEYSTPSSGARLRR